MKENLIFNLLLYSITLLFYLFTQIDLFQFIKSNNIIHAIENKLKLNFNQLIQKQVVQFKSNNAVYVSFIKEIIQNEIQHNHYLQNETNALIFLTILQKISRVTFKLCLSSINLNVSN
ncbi:unnamed protein product [Paramecium octaurelia]|uniref:Transmembrane protein n=1 Tax=Paramecium octaurelia TaxID=43137 RepID=A0A8S1RXB3_PAROT|nr:unnamed protein product [Paramecium octaurelia]